MGSYLLGDRIGSGGMGEVWQATHRLLVRPAAIKLIKPGRRGPRPVQSQRPTQRLEVGAGGLRW